uniref:NADH-ubiquinone oxidoreductase chain 2 n=1 Tax=Pecten maximus TaxID=6579 RepID=A0A0F6QTR6_PECMA|nr:NADH dehydrogenase subunit 2 [Pecten maximus]
MSFRNLSFSCGLVVASIVFSLVSPSWVGIWVGMEMNLFGAITLLVNNKKRTVDSGFKYFFAQSFGSSVMIMSLVIGSWWAGGPLISGLVGGLMVKVGAAPFHFWVVEVLDHIRVDCMWFLLTVQKFVPLCAICQGFCNSWILYICSGASVLVGAMSGVGATRLSRFVGYSSVSHTGWSLAACLGGLGVLWYYLLAYWISLGGFLYLMSGDGYLCSVSGGSVRRSTFSGGICVFLLSLGGFPPFLGFFGKLAVLLVVVSSCPLLSIPLVIGSVVSWSYYLFVMSFSIIQGSKCTKRSRSDRCFIFVLLSSIPYFMCFHVFF